MTDARLQLASQQADCLVLSNLVDLQASHSALLVTETILDRLLTASTEQLRQLKICCRLLALRQLLSPARFTFLLTNASAAVWFCLAQLDGHGMLDESLIDAVLQHPHADAFAEALKFLPNTITTQTSELEALLRHPKLPTLIANLEIIARAFPAALESLYPVLLQHPNADVINFVFLRLAHTFRLDQLNMDVLITPLLAPTFWLAAPDAPARLAQILATFRAFQMRQGLLLVTVLINDNPMQRLREFLALEVPDLTQEPQSTHHTSVHQSTADAATALQTRYGELLTTRTEDRVLTELTTGLMALPQEGDRLAVALRCLQMLVAHARLWQEPLSQIRLITLLTLIYLAIEDKSYCLASREDALLAVLQACYESQRGGNIDANQEEAHHPDQPICASGIFNKFIEKMAGILPCCQIVHLTPSLAALKLMALVKTEILAYCQQLADQQTPESRARLGTTLHRLKTEGTEAIWDEIRAPIHAKLFAEFAPRYDQNPNHPDFVGLVDSGQWLDPPEPTRLANLFHAAIRSEDVSETPSTSQPESRATAGR